MKLVKHGFTNTSLKLTAFKGPEHLYSVISNIKSTNLYASLWFELWPKVTLKRAEHM